MADSNVLLLIFYFIILTFKKTGKRKGEGTKYRYSSPRHRKAAAAATGLLVMLLSEEEEEQAEVSEGGQYPWHPSLFLLLLPVG